MNIIYFTPGYENVTSFCPVDTMYSIPRPPFNRVRRGLNFNTKALVPSIIKGLQCIGTENSPKQCLVNSATSLLSNLFRGLPPDTPRTVGNVAWVSCGGEPNLSVSLCACLQLQQVFVVKVLSVLRTVGSYGPLLRYLHIHVYANTSWKLPICNPNFCSNSVHTKYMPTGMRTPYS